MQHIMDEGSVTNFYTMNIFEEIIKLGYVIDKLGTLRNKKGKTISKTINGYISCYPTINGKRKTVAAHRFQAYMKYGDSMFRPNIEVRHLNENKLDNSWGNIDIGTHSENMMDRPKYLRKEYSALGNSTSHLRRKYDYNEVKQIYLKEKSYKKVAELYGTSKSTIYHIIKSFDNNR